MLYIETLGHLRVHIGDDKPLHFVSRRAELLLVYLALTQRPHSRESLATLLWDDRDQRQSLANFRSLLARMPKAVKPYLQVERHQVAVSSEQDSDQQLVVDALVFEEGLAAADGLTDVEDALGLYEGAFLDGVFVRDSFGLDEWIVLTREKFGRLAATTRHQLATTYLHQRQFEDGIRHARALVATDSLHEESQRLLMRLLAKNGQFNEAIQAFEACRVVLEEEMGIEPTKTTQRLAARIQAARQGVPHVVPPAATELVGRSAELATLHERLDNPKCQLLTIAGMGGVGKTRLLMAIGDERQGDYLNGVFFVPLADLTHDLELAVARVCGISLGASESPLDQLVAFMRDKELLLLLDNAEHVVDATAALVQKLTAAAPAVQIVVSSREQLALRMEWVVEVAGLQVASQPSQGAKSEALRLFERCLLQRGQVVTDLEAIAAFCELVEGNPLGIELAATAGVQADLARLVTRMRDVPTRHRSLQAVFEHSYQLLEPHEQLILGKLAVFRGSFSADAAHAVANAANTDLQALAAKSLVRNVGERFDLHEVIRHFSAEINPTLANSQTIHSRYFAQWLGQNLTQLRGGQQAVALDQFEQDRANIEQGWQTALRSADWQTLDQYITPLHDFSEIRSEFHPAHTHFLAAVEQVRPLVNNQSPVHLRRLFARLLARLGFHQERIGHYSAARGSLHEAEKLLEPFAVDDEQLFVTAHLGVTVSGLGEVHAARDYFEQALAQARQLNNQRKVAHCLSQLGHLLQTAGEWTAAEAALTESVEIWREIGGKQDLAIALNGLGNLFEAQGRLDSAEKIYRENIVVCQTLGDILGEVMSVKNLGDVQKQQGNITAAATSYTTAQQLNNQNGKLPWLDAQLTVRCADIAVLRGDLAEAKRLFMYSLAICIELGDTVGQAVNKMGLGDVERKLGAWNSAEKSLQSALRVALESKAIGFALKALLVLGNLYRDAGNLELAATVFATCIEHDLASADIRQRAESFRKDYQLPPAPPAATLEVLLQPYFTT